MKQSIKRKAFITLIIIFLLFLCLSIYVQSCKKLEFEIVARVKTGEISYITTNSASANGVIQEVGESGISQYGHCWSTDENPEVTLETKTNLGNRNYVGSFKSDLTGLLPGTRYYIRAYLISDSNTIYGDSVSFTTDADLPAIITDSISSITDTTAKGGGHVTSDGGATVIDRGVCWNTSGNPTTANSKTSNGTGTGTFTSSLTSLNPSTTYYVRAFATNSTGIAYGNQVSFTTSQTISSPTVATTEISSIRATSAQSGGNVTSDGGSTVTARGVCWNISGNPTIEDKKTIDGFGIGTFTSSLTDLNPNTTYYVKAYSTNSTGTSYGNELSFITKDTILIVWQKSLGGSYFEGAKSIHQTADGGYIVAGESHSNNGDVSGNHGQYDYWIVKLTSTGDLDWQKSLGGLYWDKAYSIQQTTDGGYIIVGDSESNNGDVSGNHGVSDYWIVKLTSIGNLDWQKSLGGNTWDYAQCISHTTGGGYMIAGSSNSNDGDVSGNHGGLDYWIVKLTSTGDIDWQKSLGGSDYDRAYSIQQTSDGGYIIAGESSSVDGDVSGNYGGVDFWIVKLTSTGNLDWQKSLGGSDYDRAYSIQQTFDGGYIIVGSSDSNDCDVSGNHGGGDYWIVKIIEN